MQAKSELTYESIVEGLLASLHSAGLLASPPPPVSWDSFLRLSNLVHQRFQIPATSFTPMMRRFLFALSHAASPKSIVGVGTFVGYTLAWLLRDRADAESGPFVEHAIAIDVDPEATATAARNCAWLGHGGRLKFVAADGAAAIGALDRGIDLLYLDLDDPYRGKSGYCDVVLAALDTLHPGTLVVAHDACEAVFHADMKRYNALLRSLGCFQGPIVLPIDPCGVSVAAFRGARP
jgi:predicted O-methyltransferase YrrM